MLRSFKELRGFAIRATDGRIGTVSDVYFDDNSWRVRYCVIDTGQWLGGRYVLVGSRRLSVVDGNSRELWVRLAKAEVRSSQRAETDKPVSKQGTTRLVSALGRLVRRHGRDRSGPQSAMAPHDHHLRSCQAVIGHRLAAVDGKIGRVDDFLIDDKAWVIRQLIIDARDDSPARSRVLLASRYINGISWPQAAVTVNMTRDAVVTAPISQTAGSKEPSPDAA
jgi:sporulation protein YlmC with PRC-barrel domain